MSDDLPDRSTPEIRLTDSDRDKVVSELGTAMSEGRIDVGEFEERTRQAYLAKVPSDLAGVLDGLPVVAPITPSRVPLSTTSGKRWFFSLLGDRVQRGDIHFADKATSVSVLGDTTFDLTQVTANEVNLQIFSLLGDVTVLVRPDTRVAANIILVLGDRKEDGGPIVSGPSLHVELRIFALLGDVKIQVVD